MDSSFSRTAVKDDRTFSPLTAERREGGRGGRREEGEERGGRRGEGGEEREERGGGGEREERGGRR